MNKKKSLLEGYPEGSVNRAEWIDRPNSIEITLYDGKGKAVSAKLTVLKGKSPEIHFFEVDDNGKQKLSKKFLVAGKGDGIVSSISLSELKKSAIPTEQKIKRPYNRRALVPGKEVPVPATEKVENVKKEVIKKASNTPKVVSKKNHEKLGNGPWTFKDNYLKLQPLQQKDLSLNFDQFVNSFVPKSSQVRVLQTLTEIMSRYGEKNQQWSINLVGTQSTKMSSLSKENISEELRDYCHHFADKMGILPPLS